MTAPGTSEITMYHFMASMLSRLPKQSNRTHRNNLFSLQACHVCRFGEMLFYFAVKVYHP